VKRLDRITARKIFKRIIYLLVAIQGYTKYVLKSQALGHKSQKMVHKIKTKGVNINSQFFLPPVMNDKLQILSCAKNRRMEAYGFHHCICN
jgi:hypothetical protein